jgi:nucleoid DNA-binding protein
MENGFAKMDIALIVKKYNLKIRQKCKDLKPGESFTIFGFATFKAMNRKERIARNPSTGKEYSIPDAKNIKIKVTGAFHRFINGISDKTDEDESDV